MLKRLLLGVVAALCLAVVQPSMHAQTRIGLSLYLGGYNTNTTYANGDVVLSGSTFYMSQQSNNSGNLLSNPTYWLPLGSASGNSSSTSSVSLASIASYSSTLVYPQGAIVLVGNTPYYSLISLNTGNAPASSPSAWASLIGPQGPAGAAGQAGQSGPAGATPTLAIGTVTSLAPGATPTAVFSGTAPNYVLNLGIPQGASGIGGSGAAPTFAVGTVTALAAGATPTASISGTAPDFVLNLGLPAGATGAQGLAGPTGQTGAPGATPALSIGTVTQLTAGYTPTASFSGTAPNYVLNLGIPSGAQGATGQAGQAGATPTFAIGSVTSLAAGATPTAAFSGTAPNYVLNLGIPQGTAGQAGQTGAAGTTPAFTIGAVTSLAAGATPTASFSGTAPNYVLNLGIPQGTTGQAGAAGSTPTFAIGAVLALAAGATPTATFSGTAPNYILNLGVPAGATGAAGPAGASSMVPYPAYSAATTYAANQPVSYNNVNYYSLVAANKGNTPPSPPATSTFWQAVSDAAGAYLTAASPTCPNGCTLTGNLSGTTASFSGSVTAQSFTTNDTVDNTVDDYTAASTGSNSGTDGSLVAPAAGHERLEYSVAQGGISIDHGTGPHRLCDTLGIGCSSILRHTFTVGATATTANALVSLDTSGNVVPTAAGAMGAYGIAETAAASGASVVVDIFGAGVSCTLDNVNPSTIGHIVVVSATTAGSCSDSGQTSGLSIPLGQNKLGIFTSATAAGGIATFNFYGAGIPGTGNIASTATANTYGSGLKQTVTSSLTMAGSGEVGVATDPTTLFAGDHWYNTTSKTQKFYDGSANHTIATLEFTNIWGGSNTFNQAVTFNNSYHGTLSFLTAAASTFTSAAPDDVISAGSNSVNATLDTTPSVGEWHFVTRSDNTANTVTITGGTYNINGKATYTGLTTQYSWVYVKFVSTSVGWVIEGQSTPIYSAATVPVPTSCTVGDRAVVTDAASATYLGAYTSGGTGKTGVTCTGNAWVTD